MSKKNVSCPIEVKDSFGDYANAFRVMQDGSDVVMDFCVYSSQENKAKLVSRVRVGAEFLEIVVARITEAMSGSTNAVEQKVLYVMPEVEGDN
jgi:hypothetical protein